MRGLCACKDRRKSDAGLFGPHASARIVNCTIAGNSFAMQGGQCGGIYSSSPTVVVKNCIVWGNTGAEIAASSTTPTVTYSDVQGGYAGTGNISGDPGFVTGYHLSANSPCIDTADNAALPQAVTTDLDGNARFVDDRDVGDTGSGTPPIVDMGAYEYVPPCTSPTVDSITPDRSVQDYSNLVAHPPYEGVGPVHGEAVHVTITGSGFDSPATVKLVQAGHEDLVAGSVVVVDSTTITADIDLTGAAPGLLDGSWDVVVTTCADGTLTSGFTVSMCFAPPPPPSRERAPSRSTSRSGARAHARTTGRLLALRVRRGACWRCAFRRKALACAARSVRALACAARSFEASRVGRRVRSGTRNLARVSSERVRRAPIPPAGRACRAPSQASSGCP